MSEPTTTEQRKDEMYAAQTMSGHLTRRIYESQVRGDSLDAIIALMDQKASLDARVQLLSHEIHNEVTYAGLGTMLSQVLAVKDDILAGQAKLQAAWEETALGLKKQIDALAEGQDQLATQVNDFGERLDEHGARLDAQDAINRDFMRTRDESIAERRRHTEQLARLEQEQQESYQAIQEYGRAAEGYHQDLSDQIGEMQRTVNQFASIMALTSDALITIDADQRIIWANGQAETLFGYTAVEMIGQHVNMLIPGRFHAQHEEDVRAFGTAAESYRQMADRQAISGLHKDGHEMTLKAGISKSKMSGTLSYTVVLRRTGEGA